MAQYKNTVLKDGESGLIVPTLDPWDGSISETSATSTFMTAWAEKATSLSLTATQTTTPDGGSGSMSCALDMLKIGLCALGNDTINHVWSKKSATIKTKNSASRSIALETTMSSTSIEPYYKILAGKTGSMGNDNALLMVSEIDGVEVLGAILGASQAGDRFPAMKQLLDIAKKILNNESVSGLSVTSATNAAVCIVPQTPSLWDDQTITPLYAQNETAQAGVASVAKVMTALTALDYINDINANIEFTQRDINAGGSGQVFQVGDLVTVRDVLLSMFLPSSNQGATALARYAGQIISSI